MRSLLEVRQDRTKRKQKYGRRRFFHQKSERLFGRENENGGDYSKNYNFPTTMANFSKVKPST